MPLKYYSYDMSNWFVFCLLWFCQKKRRDQHPHLILSLPDLTFSVHIFNGVKSLHAPLLPHWDLWELSCHLQSWNWYKHRISHKSPVLRFRSVLWEFRLAILPLPKHSRVWNNLELKGGAEGRNKNLLSIMELTFYNILFKNKHFLPHKKCFIVEPKVTLQTPGIPPGIWDLHGDTSDCIAQGI